MSVEDKPEAVAGDNYPTLNRVLTFQSEKTVDNLWFRVLVADKIVPLKDGWYQVNDDWKLQIQGVDEPALRQSNGKTELLVPIRAGGKPLTLTERFEW